MFYDNLKSVCEAQGLKISNVVTEVGGKLGSLGGWKKGAMPNSDIVMRLALRLNVTTDLLLFGEERRPSPQLGGEERLLLSYFMNLSTINKGIVIGEAKVLAEQEVKQANCDVVEEERSQKITQERELKPRSSSYEPDDLKQRLKEALEKEFGIIGSEVDTQQKDNNNKKE